MKKQQPVLKNFISEIDQVLQAFDKAHPERSLSQQVEIKRQQRIDKLRDVSDRPEDVIGRWDVI